jgi:hypothetical protein
MNNWGEKTSFIWSVADLMQARTLLTKVTLAIERLRAYRTALISATVADKIDARGEIASHPITPATRTP